ncbi:MAG TPA: DUF4412 domain-containing protein [Vicinamibacteria bacterium]|nr:DUF4412 domain-containing protein [Vicinamibacteria bacterium]
MLPTIAAVVALAAALPAGPPGDVYFEQTVVSSTDGRPTGPGVSSRVWHAAGGRMRMEAGGGEDGAALILRLAEGKAWRLDPERQIATVLDVARLRERSRMDLGLAGQLMGVEETPRLSELREPKVVAGFRCTGFRLRAGAAVMDLYLTRELPLGMEAFADFLEWSGASEALGPLLQEIRALRGFPLQTRSRVSVLGEVHETVSTVTRVRLGAPPPGLFEPPPGYRVVVEAPAAGE